MDRASRYEKEGMFAEAHAVYEDLDVRRPRKAGAHVGRKRSAQVLLDRKILEATAWYAANDLEQGERLRNEAIGMRQGMDRKGLELQWYGHLDDQRRTARSTKARDLLQEADEAFRSDRFAEAEECAMACQRLDPEMKEADYLILIAQLEPRYREGQKAETLGLWRGSGIPRCELYLLMPDLAGAELRSQAAGASIMDPSKDHDWGHRVAYFADPDGYVIALAGSIDR